MCHPHTTLESPVQVQVQFLVLRWPKGVGLSPLFVGMLFYNSFLRVVWLTRNPFPPWRCQDPFLSPESQCCHWAANCAACRCMLLGQRRSWGRRRSWSLEWPNIQVIRLAFGFVCAPTAVKPFCVNANCRSTWSRSRYWLPILICGWPWGHFGF